MNTIELKRITDITMKYYDQIEFNPSHEDFNNWISSLKEPMKSHFIKDGFKKSKGVLNFRRYYLESKDYGMKEFMKNNLSEEEFKFWNKA